MSLLEKLVQDGWFRDPPPGLKLNDLTEHQVDQIIEHGSTIVCDDAGGSWTVTVRGKLTGELTEDDIIIKRYTTPKTS